MIVLHACFNIILRTLFLIKTIKSSKYVLFLLVIYAFCINIIFLYFFKSLCSIMCIYLFVPKDLPVLYIFIDIVGISVFHTCSLRYSRLICQTLYGSDIHNKSTSLRNLYMYINHTASSTVQ